MVSRRRLVLGAGALAALSVPAYRHVSWNQQQYVRDGFSEAWPTAPEGRVPWANWSGIQQASPRQIAVPASEEALASLMAGTRGQVRPVGSGHSFSGLVPSEGIIVDTSRLNGLIEVDAANGLVTIGAGTRLRQASEQLDTLGLAFSNLPDIDVQTLAGTFSTATHGTGAGLPALHDAVQSFRMVTAAGDMLEVTPDSEPGLFSAGRVSLGALGIITRYTLKLEPAYLLRRRVWVEPAASLVARAQELATSHRHFEFYYFPGTGYAAGISHDVDQGPAVPGEASGDDALLSDLKTLRDTFGWSGWLRRKVLERGLPQGEVESAVNKSWELLATTRPVKFNEMEYELPVDEAMAVVSKIMAHLDRRKDAYFPMEVRWIAGDDAWLSPFNTGPRVSVSVHADVAESFDYFVSEIEPICRAAGGRPHWGKIHGLAHDELVQEYPHFGEFLALREQLDPQGRLLNTHLAGLFGLAV